MSVPTIDPSQSAPGYRAFETFALLAGGSGSPEILYWQATSLPPGLTLDAPAERPVTGAAATDVIADVATPYANGDKVYFPSLAGGAGLAANTVYFVRDKATDSYKLAATLTGPAIDITTDLTAGQIRKCGTSLLTGSITTTGTYTYGLIAVNATGPSAVAYFTVGIEAGDGSAAVAGSSDTGIDLNIDVVTRAVTMPSAAGVAGAASAAAVGPLFMLKGKDTVLLNVRFKKGGVALDPNPTSIKLAFKKDETEAALFTAGGLATTAWSKVGSGANAYFQVPVIVTAAALESAFSDEETPIKTLFDSLVEFEWKSALSPAVGGVSETVTTTQSFGVTLIRDMVA
jgi:hypothetical protein